MKTEAVGRAASPLAADGAHGVTRPTHFRGNSNIHSVLFEPETLDFWVANADSDNPAAHTRYTHYNLAELLKPENPE